MRLLNHIKDNWIGCLIAVISGYFTPFVLEYIGWQHSFFRFLLIFILIYIPVSIVTSIIMGFIGKTKKND